VIEIEGGGSHSDFNFQLRYSHLRKHIVDLLTDSNGFLDNRSILGIMDLKEHFGL
jgi:hypothetical protein